MRTIILMFVALSCLSSCIKKAEPKTVAEKKDVYYRITQVDKNGARKTYTIIKVKE